MNSKVAKTAESKKRFTLSFSDKSINMARFYFLLYTKICHKVIIYHCRDVDNIQKIRWSEFYEIIYYF